MTATTTTTIMLFLLTTVKVSSVSTAPQGIYLGVGLNLSQHQQSPLLKQSPFFVVAS